MTIPYYSKIRLQTALQLARDLRSFLRNEPPTYDRIVNSKIKPDEAQRMICLLCQKASEHYPVTARMLMEWTNK